MAAVTILVLMVAAVVVLTLLPAAAGQASPASPPPTTPAPEIQAEAPTDPDVSAAPVKPFPKIERGPIGMGVSFALLLYLVDADGLLSALEPAVTYLDYEAGRAAHGDVSTLRAIAAAGAAGEVFTVANTNFMEFRLPRRGVFYNRWLRDLLSEGRDAQAALIERQLTGAFDEAPTSDTHTELAAMFRTAARFRNDLAARP